MNTRLTPESTMKFGVKYKGVKLKDIPLSYWVWLRDSGMAYAQVRRYMKDYVFNKKQLTP